MVILSLMVAFSLPAQADIEFVQKVMGKAEGVQKKATAAQEKIMAYKKKMEDYAKKAKGYISDAQSMANEVKGAINDVQSMANAALKGDFSSLSVIPSDLKTAMADVKKMKDDVKNKVNDAKQMAADAKAATEGAKALAKQTVEDAKSQVSSVKDATQGAVNSVQNTTKEVTGSSLNNGLPKTERTGSSPISTVSVHNNIASGPIQSVTNTPVKATTRENIFPVTNNGINNISTATVRTDVAVPRIIGQEQQSQVVAEGISGILSPASEKIAEEKIPLDTEIKAEIDEIKATAKEQGVEDARKLLEISIDEAIKNEDTARLDALSKIEKEDILNAGNNENKTGGRRAFTNSAENIAIEGLITEAKDAKEKLRSVAPESTLKVPQKIEPEIIGITEKVSTQERSLSGKKEIAPVKTMPTQEIKGPLQKNSFLFEKDKPLRVKTSYSETLKFADEASDVPDSEDTSAAVTATLLPVESSGDSVEQAKTAKEKIQEYMRDELTALYATGFTVRTNMLKEADNRDIDMEAEDQMWQETILKAEECITRIAKFHVIEAMLSSYKYSESLQDLVVKQTEEAESEGE